MLDLTQKPVSAKLCEFLEADIANKQIVVWLDPKGLYSKLVDDLRAAGGWVAPVLAHRGSYLELMVELEHHAGSIDKSPVLIHLPGPIEVKSTPMLEIYKAGKEFRKALDTLIREAAVGRVAPADVDEFLAGPELSLANADAWMAAKVSASAGELAAKLQAMSIPALATALLDPRSPLAVQLHGPGDFGQLWNHLASHLGLPESWPYPVVAKPVTTAAQAGEAMASWALCVEYVHDLRRDAKAKPLLGIKGSLAPPLREACCAVARWLRNTAEDAYEALALDVAKWIEEEESGEPGDLGKIDTFQFEEQQLCVGAIDALDGNRWDDATQWARERLEGKSFWIKRDAARLNAWNLIAAAAALGQAVANCKLEFRTADSLDEATRRYVERGALVDRRHRELAQRTKELLFDKVPHVTRLRAAIEHVRKVYVGWQDQRAREWAALCEREGALPGPDLQQREIFESVVRPLVEDDKTVLFLVDALRFEMATELLELLGLTASKGARLRARLAELPSVTEIGMNALAPIAAACKLRPLLAGKDKTKARRFSGFSSPNNFQVTNPEQRKKAIATRAGGLACPDFKIEQLVRMTASEVRMSLRQAKLALVVSTQIDGAGEKGIGPSVFSTELLSIRAAWQLLREAGVNNFVITADHGFLLREKGDATIDHGQGHDALARYALYDVAISNAEQTSVSLRSLQYEDVEGFLVFARGVAVYSIAGDRNFVHGGNSPQERIIPVLTLEHKSPIGASDRNYQLVVEGKGSVDGMHFIQARLQIAAGQKGLAFADPESVDFDIRVVDDARVQAHTNQAALDAEMRGGVVHAKVGRSFRLLFRLTGPREARVQVELFHPSGTQSIEPQVIDRRFEVTEAKAEVPAPVTEKAEPTPRVNSDAWLDGYEPNVRRVFAHIAQFGAINQQEATAMLGSPRAFRSFSGKFEDLAARAPFAITIDTGVGLRYVKRSQK